MKHMPEQIVQDNTKRNPHRLLIAIGAVILVIEVAAVAYFAYAMRINDQENERRFASMEAKLSAPAEAETDTGARSGIDRSDEIPKVTPSPLSSYIPESCPPAMTYPVKQIESDYEIIMMACADANARNSARLVRDRKTQEDIVAYYFSSHNGLTWKMLDGEEHVLTVLGDKEWDSFEGYGGEQPVEVLDMLLDGEPLNILSETVTLRDGGLGGFQEAELRQYSNNHRTYLLEAFGEKFIIDFDNATVSLLE